MTTGVHLLVSAYNSRDTLLVEVNSSPRDVLREAFFVVGPTEFCISLTISYRIEG